jgi:hypothetical protein
MKRIATTARLAIAFSVAWLCFFPLTGLALLVLREAIPGLPVLGPHPILAAAVANSVLTLASVWWHQVERVWELHSDSIMEIGALAFLAWLLIGLALLALNIALDFFFRAWIELPVWATALISIATVAILRARKALGKRPSPVAEG